MFRFGKFKEFICEVDAEIDRNSNRVFTGKMNFIKT